MLALAGERTLGAHPLLVTPAHTQWSREILGNGPLLAPEQTVLIERDAERARDIAREKLATYLAFPNYVNMWLKLGFSEGDVVDGGSDALVDAVVAWGDAETVAKRVREHLDAGANHVCLQVLPHAAGQLPLAEWRALAESLLD
jgi:probable F420-dependent oxidoreductase